MSGNRRQKHKEKQKQDPVDNSHTLANLPEGLASVVNAVPANKRQEVTETLISVVSQMHYSGPIPPPEMLKQYDSIYPGMSKEIIENAFSETKHRHKLESEAMPAEISRMKRGQYFGFIISLIGLGSAIFLAYTGHDAVAGIIGGSTVLGLVSVFVIGKKWSKKNK